MAFEAPPPFPVDGIRILGAPHGSLPPTDSPDDPKLDHGSGLSIGHDCINRILPAPQPELHLYVRSRAWHLISDLPPLTTSFHSGKMTSNDEALPFSACLFTSLTGGFRCGNQTLSQTNASDGEYDVRYLTELLLSAVTE